MSITAKIAFMPTVSLFEGGGRLLATKCFVFLRVRGNGWDSLFFSRRWAAILAMASER